MHLQQQDGSGDCHTESSQRRTSITYHCMWNLKNNGTNELIYKRVIDAENKLTVTRGKWGRGIN